MTFVGGEKRTEVFVHSLELGHTAGTRAVKAMGGYDTHTHTHFPATGPQQIKSSILNTVKCLISCYDVQTEHDLCLGNMSYFYVLSQRTSTFCLSFVTTTCTSDFLFPLRSSIIGEAAETLWSGHAFKTFIISIITTVIV